MAIQVKKSESLSKKLYTGFFSGKVVAINPTKEELADLLGYELKEDAEDIKYSGETEKGEAFVNLSFWLEADTPEKQKFNARFRIVDKVLVSQNSGKTQYVNQSGGSTWADEEKNLAKWFTEFQDKNKKKIDDKQYRAALQGEANFYTFFRAFLAKGDFFSSSTNILIDTKKIFRNVEKFVNDEYRPLLKASPDDSLIGNVLSLATVYITEKDGEVKQYQNLYSEFMGSYMTKKFSLAISTGNFMADDKVKRFYDQLTGEHGTKDAYTLTMLQPYDPSQHSQASTKTLIQEGEVATDTDFDE